MSTTQFLLNVIHGIIIVLPFVFSGNVPLFQLDIHLMSKYVRLYIIIIAETLLRARCVVGVARHKAGRVVNMQTKHRYSSSHCSCCTLVINQFQQTIRQNLQCEDRQQLESTVGRHAIGSSRAGRKRFVAKLNSLQKNDP